MCTHGSRTFTLRTSPTMARSSPQPRPRGKRSGANASRHRSSLDSEKRDALHAVPPGGGDGLVGDEGVVVAAYLAHHQARRLNQCAITILLGGAADAGRPQLGVADDRVG